MSDYTLFVGVDISAENASVACTNNGDALAEDVFTVDQTPAGRERLQKKILAVNENPAQTLVVMEATGTYWMQLALTLHQAGFAVSVINPAQAHYFAKALLKRAKTDAIDAQTLAQLAALLKPEPWTPPPPLYEELQQRLTEREALLHMRRQVLNRLHALAQRPTFVSAVQTRMETLIALFEQQVAAVEVEIAQAFAQDEAWAASAHRLKSIPGVGTITAAWILVATLNFSTCDTPEQAAAYAGLVPQPRESGSSLQGRRAIGHTGHARLRSALYMATLSAAQHNPIIKRFYDRLRDRGKPYKVARCAAARKLLHIAWALVTKERFFDPNYHQSPLPCLTST